METLLELAAILERKRISRLDVIDKTFFNKNKNDLYYKFYDGLVNNEFTNDETACAYLYSINRPDHRYRMLKSRLRKKMINTLLLLDPEINFKNNDKNKAYFECSINLKIIETIIKLNGLNKVTTELINDNYPKAEQYKFYEILKLYSYYLLSYYSLAGDEYRYNKELVKFYDHQEKAILELKTKLLNSQLTILFTNCKKINEELIKKSQNILLELEKIIELFPDPESTYYYLHSLLSFKEITGVYNDVYDVINKIELLFIKYPIVMTIGRCTINNISKSKVQLFLKKYDDGLSTILNTKLPDISSHNWFIAKEIEFKHQIHCLRIPQCKKVFIEIKFNKFLLSQYVHTIERWKIYEAYLVFMDNYVNKGDYKFGLGKFLNEVPFYTKDKSGFNFSIKVIEILFHFARKQYNIIFAKTDALKIYRTRYLNDDTYIRSRLFLNALLKAEKDGFNSKRMKRGYPEIEQLKNREKQLIIADWEVLPYEMIWDILLDLAKVNEAGTVTS